MDFREGHQGRSLLALCLLLTPSSVIAGRSHVFGLRSSFTLTCAGNLLHAFVRPSYNTDMYVLQVRCTIDPLFQQDTSNNATRGAGDTTTPSSHRSCMARMRQNHSTLSHHQSADTI